MAVQAAVGVDVGGTNLRVALVDANGMVLEQRRTASPGGGPDDFVDAVLDLHGDLTAILPDPVALPLGLGVASIVRHGRTAVYGPNLPLGEVDLVAAFTERGLRTVTVENDANAAMYGEWRVGAARGHANALMVTMGTGVGGGAIVHGQLLRGASGFAGEAGHVGLVVDGRTCACGRRGCLEAYASGQAIAVEARERLAAGAASSLSQLAEVHGADVSAAAHDGDALAIEVLEQVGTWLGIGLTGMVNLLDPGIVVIGGGAARDTIGWVLPRVEAVLHAEVEGARHRDPVPVVPASLGDDAGIIGAALLALDASVRPSHVLEAS